MSTIEGKSKIPQYKGTIGRKAAASGSQQLSKSLLVSMSDQTSNKKVIISSPQKFVTSTSGTPAFSMQSPGCSSNPESPLTSIRIPTIKKTRKTRMFSLPNSKFGISQGTGKINNSPGHSKIACPLKPTLLLKKDNVDVLLAPRLFSTLSKTCTSTSPFEKLSPESELSNVPSASTSFAAPIQRTLSSVARIPLPSEDTLESYSDEPIQDVIDHTEFASTESLNENTDISSNKSGTSVLKTTPLGLMEITEDSEIAKADDFQSCSEFQNLHNAFRWNHISNVSKDKTVSKHEVTSLKEIEDKNVDFVKKFDTTITQEPLRLEVLTQLLKYQKSYSATKPLSPRAFLSTGEKTILEETKVSGEFDLQDQIQERGIKLNMLPKFNLGESIFKVGVKYLTAEDLSHSEEEKIRRNKLELQENLVDLQLNSVSPRLLISKNIQFIPIVYDKGIFLSSLTIQNPSDELMAYKVVTSQKNRYKAHPFVGYLPSKDNIKVSITAYMGSNFTQHIASLDKLMILGVQGYQGHEVNADEYIKSILHHHPNILQLYQINTIDWLEPKTFNVSNSSIVHGEHFLQEIHSEINEKTTEGVIKNNLSDIKEEVDEIFGEMLEIETNMMYWKGVAYGVIGSTIFAVGAIICFFGIDSFHQLKHTPPPSNGWIDWFTQI